MAPPYLNLTKPPDPSFRMRSTVWILCFIGVLLSSPALGQTFTANRAIFDPPLGDGTSISSISLADYNGDGRLDIFFPGFLYRQEPDGTFKNVLKGSGIGYVGALPKGGVFGDANLDGLLDLVFFEGQPGSRLFLNKTGGKFELGNIATALQITQPISGGFWRDLNNDGWLDLAGVVRSGNFPLYTGQANGRYTEQGPFYNYSGTANTCSVSPGDYNNDGIPEVYVNGCTAPNMLLTLTGATFRPRYVDRASVAGVASDKRSRESAWLDFNNDGWMDIIVASEYQELRNFANNLLYRNEQNLRFTDVAEAAGMPGIQRTGYNGPLAVADFDNDGWEDIYLPGNTIGALFHNNQDGTFTDIFESAFGFTEAPTAIAAGDFNNDGWMDLFDPNQGILYNNSGSQNWVTIEAKDDARNRFGVGATLRITAGGITQTRVIEAGSGGLGHGDKLKAHFGLGSSTSIEQLEIVWPNNPSEVYTDISINSHHVFVRGLGENAPPAAFSQTQPVVAGFVDLTEDIIRFEWEPATDEDPITYTLSLSGRALSLSFPGISEPFFELSTSLLPPNGVYEWSVTATDGHSVRYSGEERIFTFGQPGNTVSVYEPPVAFDFKLPSVYDGVAAFSDIDQDGDLDLLFGGQGTENGVLNVYRTVNANIPLPGDGGGSYVFKSLVLTPIYLEAMRYPKVAFGDLNGDSLPDLVVTGISSLNHTATTNIYLNSENSFVELSGSSLIDVWGGAVDWGDFDNDGDIDLLVAGAQNEDAPYEPITIIYQNNGSGGLVPLPSLLPGMVFGDASWADMDGDGDLDVAITGDRGDGYLFSSIFRNDGGQFTDIQAHFPKLVSGTVNWADFDLDGDQDLLLTGGKLSPEMFQGQTLLYINQNGSFVKHPFPFDGILSGEAAWGDYEQDGDPDLFIAGSTKPFGPPVARLFRNENGQFASELDLTGISQASIAFGDYNGDGDMDLIVMGKDEDGKIIVRFFINLQIPELIPGQ